MFGDTTRIDKPQLAANIKAEVSIADGTEGQLKTQRRIVFVGHGLHNEQIMLESYGVELGDLPAVNGILDQYGLGGSLETLLDRLTLPSLPRNMNEKRIRSTARQTMRTIPCVRCSLCCTYSTENVQAVPVMSTFWTSWHELHCLHGNPGTSLSTKMSIETCGTPQSSILASSMNEWDEIISCALCMRKHLIGLGPTSLGYDHSTTNTDDVRGFSDLETFSDPLSILLTRDCSGAALWFHCARNNAHCALRALLAVKFAQYREEHPKKYGTGRSGPGATLSAFRASLTSHFQHQLHSFPTSPTCTQTAALATLALGAVSVAAYDEQPTGSWKETKGAHIFSYLTKVTHSIRYSFHVWLILRSSVRQRRSRSARQSTGSTDLASWPVVSQYYINAYRALLTSTLGNSLSSNLNALNVGPGLAGVRPQSAPNDVSFDATFKPLDGEPSVSSFSTSDFDDSIVDSFSFKSFYFGCVVTNVETAASVTFAINGILDSTLDAALLDNFAYDITLKQGYSSVSA
ncbi:hypothetical protein LTR17_024826 [Elasticomyces elasticus]|nr:hypothetical protein LTR17_024826 [Elasticomyces elasticus]